MVIWENFSFHFFHRGIGSLSLSRLSVVDIWLSSGFQPPERPVDRLKPADLVRRENNLPGMPCDGQSVDFPMLYPCSLAACRERNYTGRSPGSCRKLGPLIMIAGTPLFNETEPPPIFGIGHPHPSPQQGFPAYPLPSTCFPKIRYIPITLRSEMGIRNPPSAQRLPPLKKRVPLPAPQGGPPYCGEPPA